MHGSCSTNERPGNDWNSGEYDSMFIRPGEYLNECLHKIWAQSKEEFVYKPTET